jgi:hypothetical protein
MTVLRTEAEIYALTDEAVERGSQFMAETYNEYWFWNPKYEHLVMSDGNSCVLGGYTGSYAKAVDEHRTHENWETDHGFLPQDILREGDELALDAVDESVIERTNRLYHFSWDTLQEQWEKKIQELRNDHPLPMT